MTQKPKEANPETAEFLGSVQMDGVEETETIETSPELEGQLNEEVKEEAPEPTKETSESKEEGSAPEEGKDAEVNSRVSKATAKNDESMKQMLTLFKNSPEKLDEVQQENPELFQRLEERYPDFMESIKPSEAPAETKEVSELTALLSEMMDKNDNEEINSWAKEKGVGQDDLTARFDLLKRRAKVMLTNNLVPDWSAAVEFAGEMVFPSTKSSGVDNGKLEQMGSQGSAAPLRTPAPTDDESQIDREAMAVTGVSKEDYDRYQSGDVEAPLS